MVKYHKRQKELLNQFKNRNWFQNTGYTLWMQLHIHFSQILQSLRQYFRFKMKKMLADTDFDDLELLSKKWKKQEQNSSRTFTDQQSLTVAPNKQNQSVSSNSPSQAQPPSKKKPAAEAMKAPAPGAVAPAPQATKKSDELIELDYRKLMQKRSHTPHVIDQDTQHFKVRLQHLLNVFKTDAISEFMSMKRSMLEDQSERVRADTEKYIKMYEQKHEELVQTRESLLEKTKECEVKTQRIQKMADLIAKEKRNTRTVRYLATPFAMLLRYKEHQQVKKFKEKQAEKSNKRRLMCKALNGWLAIFREQSGMKRKQQQEKLLEHETTEIANRYQKQIQMLRQKLAEATEQIDQYQKNKSQLQDNLKKAFMKGICAMNFEAMNALQGKAGQDLLEAECFKQPKVDQMLNSTIQNNTMMNPTMFNTSSVSFGKKEQLSKSVVVFNQPKIQSKQHKWRDAPIVGIADEPDHFDIQPLTTVPEAYGGQQGKVIKVINGRSTAVNSSKGLSPTPTKEISSKRGSGSVTGSYTPQTMNATKRK